MSHAPCLLDEEPGEAAVLAAPVERARDAALDLRRLLRPGRVLAVLSIVALALAVTSTVARLTIARITPDTYRGVVEILQRFDMDREHNVPTWFSSQLLFGCALLLGAIGLTRRPWRLRRGDCTQPDVWPWLALAAAFAYLSLDEAANLHEILIVPLRSRLDLHGVFYFAWVIPGFFAVAAFGLALRPFVRRLDRVARRRFLLAGILYVGGALGMELIGGACAEAYGFDSLRYLAAMTLEETLEMLGAAYFLYALLQHLARPVPTRLAA